MNAYVSSTLFDGKDNYTPGVIAHDQDDSLIRIWPIATNYPANGELVTVVMKSDDIVALLHLALPILSPEEVDEIAAALKPIQDAFKEAA